MQGRPSPGSFQGRGPKRVLVVAPQPFFQDRGTPIAVSHVIRALLQLGWEVDLVTYPIGTALELPGLRTFRGSNPFRIKSVPIGFSLAKIVLDIALIPTLLRRLRDPYRYIHAVEEGAALVALLKRATGVGTPLLYDMQSSLPEQMVLVAGWGNRLAQWVLKRAEAWVIGSARAIVASRGLGRHVAAPWVKEWHFPSRAEEVSAERLGFRRTALGLTKNGPLIVYVGSLAKYQGLTMLMEAMPLVLAASPEAVLLIVGGSDAESLELRKTADRLGILGSFRAVPRLSDGAAKECLAMGDVLISPRSHGRNLPLKVFDYLSAGRPIVATDIPAHRAVLDDNLAMLVPPTSRGLADGITSLLHDPDQCRTLSDAARAYGSDTLGWSGFLESVREITQFMEREDGDRDVGHRSGEE
jgi:glycosyltransferase involved in cell wall biosynthesis